MFAMLAVEELAMCVWTAFTMRQKGPAQAKQSTFAA